MNLGRGADTALDSTTGRPKVSAMFVSTAVRVLAHRLAPGLMAGRARRYERHYRDRTGVTAVANLIAGDRRVSGGPFAGMHINAPLSEIDVAPAKLSGSYEQEIAYVFADAILAGVPTFVDVGCADGYYAVGMALASPATTTYAFDLAASARRLCRETAEANGVSARVLVAGRCDVEELRRLPLDGAVVLVDIEGAEVEFLDAEVTDLLSGCTVVVEVHEDDVPGAGERLATRFAAGHAARVVEQLPRNPADFARLAGLSPEQAHLAVAEHRGPALHWLVLTPR